MEFHVIMSPKGTVSVKHDARDRHIPKTESRHFLSATPSKLRSGFFTSSNTLTMAGNKPDLRPPWLLEYRSSTVFLVATVWTSTFTVW